MENTIHLVIDLKDTTHRYPFTFANKDNYSSELSHKSHMNYYKGKNGGGADTLLEDLAGSVLHSAFYAFKQTFFKSLDKTVPRTIEEAIKDWVKKQPDMERLTAATSRYNRF